MREFLHLGFAGVFLLCVGCASEEADKSKCVYSSSEIASLELKSSGGDRSALRELELCYDFNELHEDRDRIHKKRLELEEPEALDEEAMKLLGKAKELKEPQDRRATLISALYFAKRALEVETRMGGPNDTIVRSIENELKKLDETSPP